MTQQNTKLNITANTLQSYQFQMKRILISIAVAPLMMVKDLNCMFQ